MNNALGERLKYLRKQKKTTQQDIADLLHVSQMQISRYENGKDLPGIQSVIKLADYFMVSIDYLLGHEIKTEGTKPVIPPIEETVLNGEYFLVINNGTPRFQKK